jgi:hypothetical protein
MPAAKVFYAVERLDWAWGDRVLLRLPGSTRLQSYPTREEAEQDRADREESARARVNPFIVGGDALHYQTSLDEGRLHDWALDAGVTPPNPGKGGKRNWARWWEKESPRWEEGQRRRMWEALDRVRFFTVTERPARPVVYVLVRVNWRYNDEYFIAEPDGGKVFPTSMAWRDRKKAEQVCEDHNDVGQQLWDEDVGDEPSFDLHARRARQGDPLERPPRRRWREGLLTRDKAPLWEVVEVEVGP